MPADLASKIWMLLCVNNELIKRNGATTTYAHAYLEGDEELAGAARSCTHCGSALLSTYAPDARVRCHACSRINKPWTGLLCPECHWPLSRTQVQRMRRRDNGEVVFVKVVPKKADDEAEQVRLSQVGDS